MRRLLVANRGEIASRVFRTCRELGIGTVAVFSDPDAFLPYVAEADHAVHLPGSAPADTYLRVDLLLAACAATGADAVHPGYGFLSESAQFAQAVLAAGLVWVGPPPAAIEAMGRKVSAKQRMAAAGVPVLPGGPVPVVAGAADLAAAAVLGEQVGYPLMVKADAGGGGRGMRVVRSAEELAGAVESAAAEAAAAFGDAAVFLERFAERPRHVEVQVMADSYGTVVPLFERDCSVQRRHQKVLEEAPSPVVDDALRTRLQEAAVAAARAVGYVGAGTVEFVVDAAGEPAFLEMNTRLQVEHPVTEAVTGLDLVALQLRVARGERLELSPQLTGHAVEARLYAEDPVTGLPSVGLLSRFEVPDSVRCDSGVASGSVVSVHYDALLAKLVARAPTRAEACARLAAALEQVQVHGVQTNRDLLVAVLRSPEFLAGEADTSLLSRLGFTSPPVPPEHLAAAALAAAAGRRAAAGVLGGLPSGWRATPIVLRQHVSYDGVPVDYSLDPLALSIGGVELTAPRLWSCSAAAVDLSVAGVRRRYEVNPVGDVCWVDSPLGSTVHVLDPRFPEPGSGLAAGSLTAPMPGTVLRVLARTGSSVIEGEVLLVLEAMKMEHAVRAPTAGVLELAVAAGQQVDAGALLGVVST